MPMLYDVGVCVMVNVHLCQVDDQCEINVYVNILVTRANGCGVEG